MIHNDRKYQSVGCFLYLLLSQLQIVFPFIILTLHEILEEVDQGLHLKELLLAPQGTLGFPLKEFPLFFQHLDISFSKGQIKKENLRPFL